MPEPTPILTVTMASWEWHLLLRELEEHMQVVNRDRETTMALYERIASQLAGYAVTVARPKPPAPVAHTVSPLADKPASWWKRLLGQS